MIEVGKYYRNRSTGSIYKCLELNTTGWVGQLVHSEVMPNAVIDMFNLSYDHPWEDVTLRDSELEQSQDNHVPGAKADSGKPDPTLILDGMASAILAVAEVATFGAEKYSRDGWKQVPNGFQRYSAAQDRHRLARATGEERDQESGKLHLAHEAWNALAKLALYLENNDA